MTRTLGGLTMHEIARYGNESRCLVLIALVLAALGAGGSARAQSAPEGPARAALTLDAPEDCATREAIASGVRARSRRIELVDGAQLALRVALVPAARGVFAELRVEWPDGRRSERRLSAPACAEAVDAITLLIALTLDPSSSIGQPQAAPAPAPEASQAAGGEARAGPEGQASQAIAAERAQASDSPRPADAGGDPFVFGHAALGLAFQGTLGVAPRVMPGALLTAHVAGQGAGLWSPLLQVRLGRSWLTADRASGRADFELDAAHLALCPIGLRGEALAARACAAGAVGTLRARGSETYEPMAHARLWLSAGAELLLTAELLGPLQLQAGAGVAAPLSRHRFAFAPEVFHRVAGLTGHGYLALALRLP